MEDDCAGAWEVSLLAHSRLSHVAPAVFTDDEEHGFLLGH